MLVANSVHHSSQSLASGKTVSLLWLCSVMPLTSSWKMSVAVTWLQSVLGVSLTWTDDVALLVDIPTKCAAIPRSVEESETKYTRLLIQERSTHCRTGPDADDSAITRHIVEGVTDCTYLWSKYISNLSAFPKCQRRIGLPWTIWCLGSVQS